jgi:hypothetical protein
MLNAIPVHATTWGPSVRGCRERCCTPHITSETHCVINKAKEVLLASFLLDSQVDLFGCAL